MLMPSGATLLAKSMAPGTDFPPLPLVHYSFMAPPIPPIIDAIIAMHIIAIIISQLITMASAVQHHIFASFACYIHAVRTASLLVDVPYHASGARHSPSTGQNQIKRAWYKTHPKPIKKNFPKKQRGPMCSGIITPSLQNQTKRLAKTTPKPNHK